MKKIKNKKEEREHLYKNKSAQNNKNKRQHENHGMSVKTKGHIHNTMEGLLKNAEGKNLYTASQIRVRQHARRQEIKFNYRRFYAAP